MGVGEGLGDIRNELLETIKESKQIKKSSERNRTDRRIFFSITDNGQNIEKIANISYNIGMSSPEFTIIRQEYGYAGINALGLTTEGELLTAKSIEDFPITSGLTRVIKNPPVSEATSAPIKVYFDATKICPLGCDHCLANIPHMKANKERIPSLMAPETSKICKQIIDSGTLEVKLGGGEPFVYEPFWEAIQMLGDAGVGLSTNTSGVTLCDEKQLPPEKIRLLADKKVKISISVDGEPAFHDRLRKRDGLLNQVLDRGIERLIEHGVPKRKIELRSTILNTEESINQVGYLDKLARELQLNVRIRLARPSGGSVTNGVAVLESDSKTRKLLKTLRETAQKSDLVNLEEFLRYDRPAFIHTGLDCGAGTRLAHIGPNGEASICGFLDTFFPETHDLLNGISLLDVWQKGDAFLQIREYFRRENQESKCRNCQYVDACQGGCPSVRLSVDAEINPLCPREILDPIT